MEIKPEKYSSIIPPPPVVLVSTLHGDVKNLAPFGMNMPVSFHPPLYAVGVSKTRDTYKNIAETGEFVVAVPDPGLMEAINTASESFPREVSEFEKTGLTPVKSAVVKPFRVKECQSNFECKLEWSKEAGDHYMVVGRVVAAWIDDRIYTEDLSRLMIDPVYHVSSKKTEYARKGDLIK
jgi:flavin reductase (DIM6/NTAB) family NADH-FMN oxidoreductase RutF